MAASSLQTLAAPKYAPDYLTGDQMDATGPMQVPSGGYRQSGDGRERGRFWLEDFLEMKSMFGYSVDRR